MNCVLCDSLREEQDRIVYQDEHVFVLVNLEPLRDGHVMILPVRHAEELKDLTPEESRAFLAAIDLCMTGVASAYEDPPMCFVNGWEYRTQRHLHAHVLPSEKGLRGLYSETEGRIERKRAEAHVLRGMAEKLKPFLQKLK